MSRTREILASQRKDIRRYTRYGFGKPKSKAAQALSLAKKNKSRIKSGLEYFSFPAPAETAFLDAQALSTTIRADLLGMVGHNDDVLVKSIQLKLNIQQNLTSSLSDTWRVDLICDTAPQFDTPPTGLMLFGDATPATYTFYDFPIVKRYRVLRSWRGVFNESSIVNEVIDAYVKINRKTLSKSLGSFTESSITRNKYYLISWTDAGANQPTISGRFRLVTQDTDSG